jgi:hypothetical protein
MKILDIPQSGKNGTMVSYKHRTGQFRRKYVCPRDPRTPAQLARRDAFQQAAALWATLTQEQYRLWRAAAEGRHTKKRLNQSGGLLAYQLFCRINCNLAAIGLPMVVEPPPVPQFGDDPVTELRITLTDGVLALKLVVRGQPVQYVVVVGAEPRSAATNYVDHFTILGVLPEPVGGEADITELYVRQWGQPRPGSRVFIQVIQQINGWQHRPLRLSALVPTA